MDRIPVGDVLSSPIDVPEKWIHTVDDNVVAGKLLHSNQPAHL